MSHTHRITTTLIILLGLSVQVHASNWYPLKALSNYFWPEAPAQCQEFQLLDLGFLLDSQFQQSIQDLGYDPEFLLGMGIKTDFDLKKACDHSQSQNQLNSPELNQRIHNYSQLRKEIRQTYKELKAVSYDDKKALQPIVHNIMTLLIKKALVSLQIDPYYVKSQGSNAPRFITEEL